MVFSTEICIKRLESKFKSWTSGNKRIDAFIQKRQLKIYNNYDIPFEWIPYNQFDQIKETGKNGLITVYSAIWRDGPLHWDHRYYRYTRDSNKKVALKCLHNLQNPIEFVINEVLFNNIITIILIISFY
jgi:hypothetical protein